MPAKEAALLPGGTGALYSRHHRVARSAGLLTLDRADEWTHDIVFVDLDRGLVRSSESIPAIAGRKHLESELKSAWKKFLRSLPKGTNRV